MKIRGEVGRIIAEARKKKNITQNELASQLNVTNKAISNWETGKNLPDTEIIETLEKVLEINLRENVEKPVYIRKNRILFLLLIIVVFLSLPLLLYFLFNYNRINIYSISLNSDKYIMEDSFITITNKNIILDLNKIKINEMPYNPKYKFTLYCNDNIILEKNNYEGITINENKKDLSIISKDFVKNLDNLYIKLEYQDAYSKNVVEKIELKVNKIDGNDKIFYKKENSKEVIDDSTLNLLKNNSYKKINNYLYEKKVGEKLYQFNALNNTLNLHYCKEDYCIDGTMSSLIILSYIATRNGKIIEYDLLFRDKDLVKFNKLAEENDSMKYYIEVRESLQNEYGKIKE